MQGYYAVTMPSVSSLLDWLTEDFSFSEEFIGRPVTMYADSFVIDLLYSNDRQEQLAAPNAMVVLNVWMEVIQKVRYFKDYVYSFSCLYSLKFCFILPRLVVFCIYFLQINSLDEREAFRRRRCIIAH